MLHSLNTRGIREDCAGNDPNVAHGESGSMAALAGKREMYRSLVGTGIGEEPCAGYGVNRDG